MPAQLVAFSGFSATNYVQEAYSSDLDYGVGEWNLSAWVKTVGYGAANLLANSASDTGFLGNGTAPPPVTNSVLWLGKLTTQVSYSAASALGYGGSRADRTAGPAASGIITVPLVTGLKVSLSRALTGSEGLIIYWTGNFATDSFFINAANSAQFVGAFSEATTTCLAEYAVGNGTIYPVLYLDSALTSPLEVYLAEGHLNYGDVLHKYVPVVGSAFYLPITPIAQRAAISGPAITLGIDYLGRISASAFDGVTTRTVTAPARYSNGAFVKARVTYLPTGKLGLNVNGLEVASVTGAPLLTMNSRYNLLTKTEDFGAAVWVKATMTTAYGAVDPTAGTTATTLTATAALASIYQEIAGATPAGSPVSLWVRRRAGVGAISMWNGSAKVAITVTTGWTEVTTTHNGTGSLYLALYFDTLNDAIDVWHPQAKIGAAAPYQRVNTATDFDFAATLTIGNSRTLDAPFPGSITMLKTGATVPTTEQSLWMYEQEKAMFRPDAQITLPSTATVIDLTYDESQDKWISVQAGNESSFTGLIRTNTTAVSAGSFTKVDAKSGVKLLARATTFPGVDVTIPAMGLREELVRRGEAAAKASKTLTVFDFDAVAAQTDFTLPLGWSATEVLSAGNSKREGATKDFIRLFDGFRETIRFAVAPGAAAWVQLTGKKD